MKAGVRTSSQCSFLLINRCRVFRKNAAIDAFWEQHVCSLQRESFKRYEYVQTFDLLDRIIVGLRFEKRPMSCAIREGRGKRLGGVFSLLEIANRVGPTWSL